MASKKTIPRKAAQKPAASKSASVKLPVKSGSVPAAPVRKPAEPTAKTCPLVLDGEVDAADFSRSDCLTCSEFDCRFCEAEAGSGALRSRLFAASEDGEDGGDEDGWGSVPDEAGEDEGGSEEGEGEEDLF